MEKNTYYEAWFAVCEYFHSNDYQDRLDTGQFEHIHHTRRKNQVVRWDEVKSSGLDEENWCRKKVVKTIYFLYFLKIEKNIRETKHSMMLSEATYLLY